MKKTLIIATLAFCCFATIQSCPMAIENDGDDKMIVFDFNNEQAVYIKPGSSKTIDPTLHGWTKYIFNEKLNIYIKNEDGIFILRYQLTEKFCTPEKTELSLTDIKGFVENPTKRFWTKKYEIQKQQPHKH